jgi:hypothetical protein
MKSGAVCLAALLVARALPGQQLDIGSRTVMPGVEAPRASTAPLAMHSLPGVMRPASFMLERGDSQRFGPYDYLEGTRIGSATAGLVLRVADANSFHLENPRDNSRRGPFPYRDGAELTVGTNLFRVLRLPSRIAGHWRIGGALPGASATLAVASRPAAAGAMVELRAQLQALDERVRRESADVLFEGVPTVRGPPGFRRDNIVTRSQRDRDNARHTAEASAALLIERFVRQHMPLKLSVGADGAFASPALPPGGYILCGLARVRDARPPNPGSPSRLAVWWTECELGKHDLVTYSLDDGNAIGWSGIFKP